MRCLYIVPVGSGAARVRHVGVQELQPGMLSKRTSAHMRQRVKMAAHCCARAATSVPSSALRNSSFVDEGDRSSGGGRGAASRLPGSLAPKAVPAVLGNALTIARSLCSAGAGAAATERPGPAPLLAASRCASACRALSMRCVSSGARTSFTAGCCALAASGWAPCADTVAAGTRGACRFPAAAAHK